MVSWKQNPGSYPGFFVFAHSKSLKLSSTPEFREHLVHGLWGLRMMEVEHHKRREKAKLYLEDFFNGKVEGHGILQGRDGEVKRRFHLDMKCEVKGHQITIHETFRWSHGKTQKRVWYVTSLSKSKFKATAPDCVGEAHGEIHGRAAQWFYTLAVPLRKGLPSLHVKFDDRMYMIERNALMNVIKMSKFGVHLGSITISLRKR